MTYDELAVFHKILIKKLLKYGLDEQIIRWIVKCLSRQVQRAIISHAKYSLRTVTSGVPQVQYCSMFSQMIWMMRQVALSANLLMTPNQEKQLIGRGTSVGWINELDRNVIQFSEGKGKVPHLGRNKPMYPLYVRTTQLCRKMMDIKLTVCSNVLLQ